MKNKNHIRMQTSAIFVKKRLTIKIKNNRWQKYSKDKKYRKFKYHLNVFMQVNKEVLHIKIM